MKKAWPWAFLLLAIALLCARLFVFEPFRAPAGSMVPALDQGDHFLINKLSRSPARGDIIVFQYPRDPEKEFVKRVIAVGGDTVEIKDDQVWLNGAALPHTKKGLVKRDELDEDGLTVHHEYQAVEEQLGGKTYTVYYQPKSPRQSFRALKIPAGSYYVLGDNRDNSHDSRWWGSVSKDAIRGTVSTVWYRPKK